MSKYCRCVAVLVVATFAASAGAATTPPKSNNEDLAVTVEALKAKLADYEKRIAELENHSAKSGLTKDEVVKLVQEINADAAKRSALPAWMENLTFGGDLRLRYQNDSYDWGAKRDSEYGARNRSRVRLRFGFVKTWPDNDLEVGFRLASGANNDPTTTNQTLGDTSGPGGSTTEPPFAKRPVWIDLAYAKYTPRQVKGLTLIGGKMKNPMLLNDVFMDTDVNPEGYWGEYKLSRPECPLEPFAGAGLFLLTERVTTSAAPLTDTWMGAFQAGTAYKFDKDTKYTFATIFQKYRGYANSPALARGNDSPLSNVPDFGIIDLSNGVDFKAFNQPINVFVDWAHNCDAGDPTHNYSGQDNAFATGFKIGQNNKKGDWSVKYRYARVEANALPGEIVDADFGFANRQGHVIGTEYNLLDSLSVGVNLFLTQPIFSPTTTANGTSAYENMTLTVQADLIWKF